MGATPVPRDARTKRSVEIDLTAYERKRRGRRAHAVKMANPTQRRIEMPISIAPTVALYGAIRTATV
jgi:hypothetical protein